jgi:Putative Ig domain
MTATGGVPPLTWSATNLPTGLTINSSTGVISGKTAATTGSFTPTVTVKDSGAPRSRSVTFTWSVVLPLTMDSYAPPAAAKGSIVDYQLAGLTHGGVPPYTWSVVNPPDGLTLNPATGRVTGTLSYGTQFIATAVVTDSTGAQAQTDIVVPVTAGGNDMRVVSPTGTTRTNAVGTTITTFQATANGSNPPSHTWTALNLPPGLVVSPTGSISGKPTKAGTYRVTLTVTNNLNDLARLMFDWKIT